MERGYTRWVIFPPQRSGEITMKYFGKEVTIWWEPHRADGDQIQTYYSQTEYDIWIVKPSMEPMNRSGVCNEFVHLLETSAWMTISKDEEQKRAIREIAKTLIFLEARTEVSSPGKKICSDIYRNPETYLVNFRSANIALDHAIRRIAADRGIPGPLRAPETIWIPVEFLKGLEPAVRFALGGEWNPNETGP